MGVAGQVLSSISQYQQAQSQAAAGKYNADALKAQARTALAQGNASEDQLRASQRAQLGRDTAAAAEGNVDIAGGVAGSLAQERGDMAYDALVLRYKSHLEASGLNANAMLSKYQAKAQESYGRQALAMGLVGAGAKALTGYGSYQLYGGGTPGSPASQGRVGLGPRELFPEGFDD